MRPSNCKVHLLDVGSSQYGDCLIIEYEGENILIDAGHRSDLTGSSGHRSIPQQMDAIFGSSSRPHQFSLVVVSHAHADHVGCLPELLNSGVITTDWALLTDPDLAWSPGEHLATDHPSQGIFAALREEPRLDIVTADQLSDFEADAVKLQMRYRQMIQHLKENGVTVIRHGRDALKPLHDRFANIELRVIGPSRAHVKECAKLLGVLSDDMRMHVDQGALGDGEQGALQLYRQLARHWIQDDAESADGDGLRFGDVVNMQSIVLRLGRKGRRFLLSGDSQLEKPRVCGEVGKEDVARMLRKIQRGAPYDFMKVGHHGSDNAFGKALLSAVGEQTSRFGICSGAGGGHHPSAATLGLLENRPSTKWGRTDRNGLVTFDFSRDQVDIHLERGETNDASSPARERPAVALTEKTHITPAKPSMPSTRTATVTEIGASAGHPSVEIRVPYIAGATVQVTVTFNSGERLPAVVDAPFRLASGRTLPPLLMVTHTKQLRQNVGSIIVDQILAEFTRAGMITLDLAASGASSSLQAREAVRTALEEHACIEGVVIVGGYDVVPSVIVDTLGRSAPAMRRQQDSERFVVWSDWPYGDRNNDGFTDVPVSRVPDGASAALLRASLACDAHSYTERHGVRNAARPFADAIFSKLPGNAQMLASVPHVRSGAEPMTAADAIYFMLHGDYAEPDLYTGEDAAFGLVAAFHADDLRLKPGAIIFTGCCWGGLTVEQPASVTPQTPVPLPAARSIALRALEQGASAFIGCTGVHYSPLTKPYDRFGPLLHTKFWDNIGKGLPPAKAMWQARRDYGAGIYSRHPDEASLPGADIERKMYEQYTVLGLGW